MHPMLQIRIAPRDGDGRIRTRHVMPHMRGTAAEKRGRHREKEPDCSYDDSNSLARPRDVHETEIPAKQPRQIRMRELQIPILDGKISRPSGVPVLRQAQDPNNGRSLSGCLVARRDPKRV